MYPIVLLQEVDQLKSVRLRLEGVAERYPDIALTLLTICETITRSAVLIEVLVRSRSDDEPVVN